MERPIIINGTTSSPDNVTPQAMVDFLVQTYPRLERIGIRYTIKVSVPFCLFPPGFIDQLRAAGRLLSGCHLLKGNGIVVDPRGRLIPCNHFCDNPLGEVRTEYPTPEHFQAFRSRPDIKAFYQTMGACPDARCVDCPEWRECGAGCRVHWFHMDSRQLLPSTGIERR